MDDVNSCRVLLVEDDPADASLERQTLRASTEQRFEVVTAGTLAEGLQQLRESAFDVLLLDLSLPDSRGLDTVRAIASTPHVPPFIVLTGHDDREAALQTLKFGAQDYLTKGAFDTEILVRTIRYAIERKQLSERLQAGHDLLVKLSEHVPGIIFQYRLYPDGRSCFPYASKAMLDLYGVTPEDAAQDASVIFSYQHPEDGPGILASIQESARNLTLWHHEYRIVLPGQGVRWRCGDARPEKLEDGSILWHGFITDITDSKLAEERLLLASRVFETTGEAILITDVDAQIIAVNPAFCRITGYTEQEVLGRNPRLLSSGRHNKEFWQAMWQTLLEKGEWEGEVWNRRKGGEQFPEWLTVSAVRNAQGEIIQYAAVFADLSDIRSAQQKADQLSWRDPLTGLANRSLFLRQLEQGLAAAHQQKHYANVLLLDLDRFKDINEARGLATGDALLKIISGRLSKVLKPEELLARLDSDEFAVLLPRLRLTREEAGRDALAVAEKLLSALRIPCEIEGETFRLGASIGISLFPDQPMETPSDVLRQADLAMRQAKADGGGRTAFFETAMGEAVKDRYRMERELRQAIEENQLRLYLQSQVDENGRVIGAESLVRWQHPQRGLILPAAFIPLAEASDLIVAIDRWMMAEVCRLLARLDMEGRSIRVAVNISPRHFQKADFVEEIKRLLSASGADPSHLVLEVTENLMLGDIPDIVAKMTVLAARGIHFSMDDFGTGYSSLGYLKRLPIHELKIDRSFIQDAPSDPNDAALVETILAVAQHMHLRVVAEGVETQAQADFLNARGKVLHQGYLYGRPEPSDIWLMRIAAGKEAE